jgi:hypothetical protein
VHGKHAGPDEQDRGTQQQELPSVHSAGTPRDAGLTLLAGWRPGEWSRGWGCLSAGHGGHYTARLFRSVASEPGHAGGGGGRPARHEAGKVPAPQGA